MKNKKPNQDATPKSKVKIKSLKLAKEKIQNLSDADAGAVKGGVPTSRLH